MPVWVDKRAACCSLDSSCTWLCFPAGALESLLSCQAVFLADYRSHPEKLDHAAIQPIFIHSHNLRIKKTVAHTHTHALTRKHTQSQACSVTLHLCWGSSLNTDTDGEMKPVMQRLIPSQCVRERFKDRTFVVERRERQCDKD